MENALKTVGILAALAATTLAFPHPAAAKPFPAGIVNLTGSISAHNPIGHIYAHPWQNVNVDGMRFRKGWEDIETQEGVYIWRLNEECIALAANFGKFIAFHLLY